jgi:hypothetical protein
VRYTQPRITFPLYRRTVSLDTLDISVTVRVLPHSRHHQHHYQHHHHHFKKMSGLMHMSVDLRGSSAVGKAHVLHDNIGASQIRNLSNLFTVIIIVIIIIITRFQSGDQVCISTPTVVITSSVLSCVAHHDHHVIIIIIITITIIIYVFVV